MLWTYELKDFTERLNVLKVDDDGITPMEKFSSTTTDISLKNHHTQVCPVYVLDKIFQGNKAGITKWESLSIVGIYIRDSPFHSGSVALVLNPELGHVSPQFNVVFDDEFYTVTLITEDKIPPNCTDLVQGSSQSGAPDNIYLKDTWFTLDIEEYPSKNPTHVPRVEPEIPVREGV